MRLVIFEGSREEFEAIRPLADGTIVVGKSEDGGGELGSGVEAADRPRPEASGDPTYEQALTLLRHRGGASKNQKRVLRALYEAEGPLRSSEICEQYGWKKKNFRGVRAGFAQRVKHALADGDVHWLRRRWNVDAEENEYEMPETVRQALADEYGW